MFALLAVIFFLAAVLVHGGLVTVHSHWLDWTGLMLLGLLCLCLSGYGPSPSWLKRWQQR